MAEPTDAVLPILRNIQEDVSATRAGIRALDAKTNDVAENVIELKEDVADMRRDMLMHLGLTTKHRADFEELKTEVENLKARVAVLESQS